MISKWYLLRIGRHRREEPSLNLFGGLSDQEEKTILQIQQEAGKALDHGYQKICLAWNFIYHSQKSRLFSLILEKPRLFALSVHKKSLTAFIKALAEEITSSADIKNQLLLNYLIDEEPFFFKKYEKEYPHFVLTWLGYKKTNLKDIRNGLKQKKTDIFLSFPCAHKKHPELYSPEEISSFLSREFYPPPPYDCFNLSVPADLKLEPSLKPEVLAKEPPAGLSLKIKKTDQAGDSQVDSDQENDNQVNQAGEVPAGFTAQKKSLKASVVIPVYGDCYELILTLKHLERQDLDKTQFELIVVDDGSPAPIAGRLGSLDFLKQMNFKFIYFPRVKVRTGPKDHRFRAGIARNLGARAAQGENLFFLDADILIPPSYISACLKELEKHPVIQHPRYHLKPSAPVEYEKIIKARHCFVRGRSYWEDFYESSMDWNKRRLPWKYISTNTLCLKTEIFKKAGGFRKNYTCYGFEDTDLGYRLYQSRIPFYLRKMNTYHLYRKSEILGRESLKQELLGFSGLTFFHNTHSLSAYKEFYHLIKQNEACS